MSGSTADIIAIPIVTTIALAVWLILVYYAAAHPQWKHGPSAAEPENLTPAGDQDRSVKADHPDRSAEPRTADRAA